MGKNLILGAAIGYEFSELLPFLSSLSLTGYSGDVCFLVGNISTETANALRQLRVELLTTTDARLRDMTVNCARFSIYASYLEAVQERYENVMLTDVRDVIFQRDPFDWEVGSRAHFFLEDRGKTIGTCPFNAYWIQHLFGEEALTRLSAERIICSGISIGARPAMTEYLSEMLRCFETIQDKLKFFVGDQGVHNFIAHEGRLPSACVWENEESAVLTMGHMDWKTVRFSRDGLLQNADGSVAHVVHQYDRDAVLRNLLVARYDHF